MSVLSGLVPVFILLAMGFAARQLALVTDEASAGLNRLVANLALPALFILKIGTADLARSFSIVLVATTAGLLVVTTGIALLASIALQLPRSQRGVLAQAAMRGNLAYVAFPVILGAFGDAGLEEAAVTSAVLIPLMNFLAVAVLEANRGERMEAVVPLVGRVVANPLVVSALLGLGLAGVGWRPWDWLARTLGILSDFALPGALLALGAQLRVGHWGALWRPTAVASTLKLVVQPLAALWLLSAFGLRGLPLGVGVLLLAAPTAVASYPVAADLGGDTDLAGACVLATTLGGVVTYLAWSLVLAG